MSIEFMGPRFLLKSEVAKRLYDSFASDQPIYDYHCHLDAKEILENQYFTDIGELWLKGDHYKWRLMRATGVPEEKITGNSVSFEEKFYAFAEVLPYFIGNPVYHWAHLELQKYFGIHDALSPKTARKIYEQTQEKMAAGGFSVRELIERSKVELIATTNHPKEELKWHQRLQESSDLATKVVPTFRPDAFLHVEWERFHTEVREFGVQYGIDMQNLDDLLALLMRRMDDFATVGCRIADHGLTDFPTVKGSYSEAKAIFQKVMNRTEITFLDMQKYQYYLLYFLGSEYARRDWVMQLHLSPLRNTNTRIYHSLGPDAGVDSVGDPVSARALQQWFDEVELAGGVPRTLLFTLNPSAYYVMATMAGNYQGGVKGKIQMGPAWWMLDHRDGIEEQLRLVANTGGLGLFVGMTTDSRSYLSYARHDYFRRILCSLIGEWIEDGEVPDDPVMVGDLIRGVSVENARNYFRI